MLCSRELLLLFVAWLEDDVDPSAARKAGGGSVNVDSISVEGTAFSNALRSVDPVGVGGGLGRGIMACPELVGRFSLLDL